MNNDSKVDFIPNWGTDTSVQSPEPGKSFDIAYSQNIHSFGFPPQGNETKFESIPDVSNIPNRIIAPMEHEISYITRGNNGFIDHDDETEIVELLQACPDPIAAPNAINFYTAPEVALGY